MLNPAEPPRDALLRAAALALAGAWAGYFFITGMPQLTIEVFPATLTLQLIVAAAAAVYVGYLAFARRLPGGTPLDLPVLGFLVAYALASYGSSYWRVGLDATLQIGVALIAFYALSDLPSLSARSLRRALLLAAAALALYALWVVGGDYVDYLRFTDSVEGLGSSNIFPPTVFRVHDVSDHPNVVAMLLALFLPFFALSAYSAPSRWERGAAAFGLLAGAMASFLTLSRGGWIGAGAGIALTVAGAWVTSRIFEAEERDGRATWRAAIPGSLSPTAIASIAGAAILVVVGTLAFINSSSTRPGWLFRGSLSPREDAWEAGLEMFGDNVLNGAGPNTYGLLYPSYSGKFLIHTQHAHNGFLQVADDAGILGLLALAAIGVATAYMLWRTWREGSLEQRLLAVACASGLIGFSLHNQLDAGNIWKAPGIALALVGAIVVRVYRERRADAATPAATRNAGLAARAVLLALVVVPFAAWVPIDAAHFDYWQGLDDFNNGRAGSLLRMQEAADRDEDVMVYQMQLGISQATVYRASGANDATLLDSAIARLERAVELDERSPLGHANLARAYELAGRDDDAEREAQLARLTQQHVPPVLMVAEVYEDMGREERAIETYGQALSMDAGLADSEFWQGSDFRREHFDEIVERSTIGINPCTKGGFLVQAVRSGGRKSFDGLDAALEGCKLLLLAFPNDLNLRVALAKMLDESSEPAEAFGHLNFAVTRQPDFGPAHTELGRWYEARGDIDAARHEWAVGGQLDEAESLLLLGDSYAACDVPGEVSRRLRDLLPRFGSSIRNDTISVLYYRMRYGRISPQTALIPGEWQQAVPRLNVGMQRALERWGAGC